MKENLLGLTLVIDANILIKILREEPDSQVAVDFLTYCNSQLVQFYAPTLFQYEVMNVAVKEKVSLEDTAALLNQFKATNLTLLEPNYDEWLLAEKICHDGHPKSGFPSLYDSIYHVMAIHHNATFITADNRHLIKAKQHGSIILLNDWQKVF